MKTIDELNAEMLSLCYKIEELPASELQTNISVMASNLRTDILEMADKIKAELLIDIARGIKIYKLGSVNGKNIDRGEFGVGFNVALNKAIETVLYRLPLEYYNEDKIKEEFFKKEESI